MNNLINIEKTRKTIRRLFKNNISEIVNELLQNAQRSQSSKVDFTTNKNQVIYQDDGTGVQCFTSLIVLGESKYSLETINNQSPMGIGFNSLLAHEDVSLIKIISQGKSLEIDTQLWWNDFQYANNWKTRLQEIEITKGTTIIIETKTDADFVKKLENCLTITTDSPIYQHKDKNPAWGYFLVNLQIFMNKQEINNGYPDKLKQSILVESNYQEAKLTIFNQKKYGRNYQYINWYGQLVFPQNISFEFPFCLEIIPLLSLSERDSYGERITAIS